MLSLHIILTILFKSKDNIFCYHLYYVILLSFTKYITVYDNKLSKIIYDLTDHIERNLREAHDKELPLERPYIDTSYLNHQSLRLLPHQLLLLFWCIPSLSKTSTRILKKEN